MDFLKIAAALTTELGQPVYKFRGDTHFEHPETGEVVPVADYLSAAALAEIAATEAEDAARAARNQLLADSDWTQAADAPVDQSAWAAYRAALRDLPTQPNWPDQIIWPQAPEN